MDVNASVRAFCKLAGETTCDAIQVWRGQVGGRPAADDLIATSPIDKTLDPNRLAAAIIAESDECAGRTRFTIKGVRAGVEVVRDRLILDGGQPEQLQRNTHTRALVTPTAGVGPARPIDGVLDEVGEMQGVEFGARTNAAIASALLREQMKQNVQLVGMLMDHSAKMQGPLLKQTETLSSALQVAHKQLIEGAEQHVAHVRQGRALEAEAKTEERKAAAFEKTGEAFAKYLPGVLARFSRKYGIVGDDDENDPLLEKLVKSFKSSQIERMQKVLDPEQLALFAEVWASIDEREGKREAKKKNGGKKNGRKVVSGTTRESKSETPADAPDSAATVNAAAALGAAFGGLRLGAGT